MGRKPRKRSFAEPPATPAVVQAAPKTVQSNARAVPLRLFTIK